MLLKMAVPLFMLQPLLETRDVAELLIANGADINATGKNGLTPLAYALEKEKDVVAEMLRQHGGK